MKGGAKGSILPKAWGICDYILNGEAREKKNEFHMKEIHPSWTMVVIHTP
jgi:hypothetical protein